MERITLEPSKSIIIVAIYCNFPNGCHRRKKSQYKKNKKTVKETVLLRFFESKINKVYSKFVCSAFSILITTMEKFERESFQIEEIKSARDELFYNLLLLLYKDDIIELKIDQLFKFEFDTSESLQQYLNKDEDIFQKNFSQFIPKDEQMHHQLTQDEQIRVGKLFQKFIQTICNNFVKYYRLNDEVVSKLDVMSMCLKKSEIIDRMKYFQKSFNMTTEEDIKGLHEDIISLTKLNQVQLAQSTQTDIQRIEYLQLQSFKLFSRVLSNLLVLTSGSVGCERLCSRLKFQLKDQISLLKTPVLDSILVLSEQTLH